MTDSYLTVSSSAITETVINKSRFIGFAIPCASESEALESLERIRSEHKTAKHHCYAYIIGENSGIMRYSDDGEPGGTAGLPMMDVLKNRHIVNCCIIVVRYFGGVLLGTGGLVRAYSGAAQSALEAAGIVRMEMTTDQYCCLPYAQWDRFRYAADHLPVKIENVEYGSSVTCHILFRSSDGPEIMPRLLESSDRRMKLISCTESFSAWTVP